MDSYKEIKELLRQLTPPKIDSINPTLIQAVVDSVETNDEGEEVCTIRLPDDNVFVSGCRWLVDAYYPHPGDCVWVLRNRGDRFILGRTRGSGLGASMEGTSGRPFISQSPSALEVANGSWTDVPVDVLEAGAFFGLGGGSFCAYEAPSVTIGVAGLYRVSSFYEYESNSTGERAVGVSVNASNQRLDRRPATTNPFAGSGMRVFSFEEGDVVTPIAHQTSGSAIDLTAFQLQIEMISQTQPTV